MELSTLLNYILTSSSANLAATTTTQIFTTPSSARGAILITNCDTTGVLNVGFLSATTSTKFTYELMPGQQVTCYVGPAIPIYLYSTTTCYYCALEVDIRKI